MASLTDNLPNAQASRRIIDPQNDKAPTFLASLANVAEQAVNGGARLFERNQAENQRQAALAAKARKDGAEDWAAGVQFDYLTNRGQFAPPAPLNPEPQMPTQPAPFDAELEGAPPPTSIKRAIDEVRRNQSAEDQGRAPSGSTKITLESVIAAKYAEMPDQRAEIADWFRTAGFDHYLFREAEVNKKVEDNNIDIELQGQKTYADVAYKAGMVPAGATALDAAAIGRSIANMDYVTKQEREKAQAAAAQASAGREDFNFNKARSDEAVAQSAMQSATSSLLPFLNRITSLATEAGASGDPTKQKTFEQLVPEFSQQLTMVSNNYRAALIARGASPEAVAQFDNQAKQYSDQLVALTSGPLSQFATTQRALTSVQTTLKLDAAQALPVYTSLVGLMGQSAVADLFGGTMSTVLPPSVTESITNELKGIQGLIDTDPEKVSMANIAALLRGKTGIDQMTERQAAKAMPALMTIAMAGQRDLASNSPNANPTAFFNASLAGNNAAIELQPGMDHVRARQVATAAGGLLNANATLALFNLQKTNPQDADILARSTRATATHLLNIAQTRALSDAETMSGLWSVKEVRGQYENVMTRESYNRWAGTVGQREGVAAAFGAAPGLAGGQRVQSFEELQRQGAPRALREHTGAMNLSIRYLQDTRAFDEDWAGVSKAEISRLLINKEVPVAMQRRAEQRQTFAERANAIRTDLGTAAAGAVDLQVQTNQSVAAGARPKAAADYFVSKGYSPQVSAGIVGNLMAESGPTMQTSARGDGGKAFSLAQWHPDRQAEAAKQGFDLTDFNQALAFVDWELNNTESAAGRALKNAKTPQEAADIFALRFLRPRGAETGNADNVHNIAGRRAHAQTVFGR